eukprot:1929111-Amphidinium_carterae.3
MLGAGCAGCAGCDACGAAAGQRRVRCRLLVRRWKLYVSCGVKRESRACGRSHRDSRDVAK